MLKAHQFLRRVIKHLADQLHNDIIKLFELDRPEARGLILGINQHTTKSHLCRAVLDAVAFTTREVLDTMQSDTQIQLSTLLVDGGKENQGTYSCNVGGMGDRSGKNVLSRSFSNTNNNDATIRTKAKGNRNPALLIILLKTSPDKYTANDR